MRSSLHTAVKAGLIAALVLTATPVLAGSTFSFTLDAAERTAPATSDTVTERKELKFMPPASGRKELVNFGNASWYGAAWQGNRTASGRVYDFNDFTAAHPSLPFGTVLRVHNKTNKQHVLVVVTDRGPFIRGRVLDLSARAAKRLQMTTAGVAPIAMEVVAREDGAPLNANNGFFLRLDRAKTTSDAQNLSAAYQHRLKRDVRVLLSGPAPSIEFEICVGPYESFDAAEQAVAELEPGVKVKDIIEGPTQGRVLALTTAPPEMTLDPDGTPRTALSGN